MINRWTPRSSPPELQAPVQDLREIARGGLGVLGEDSRCSFLLLTCRDRYMPEQEDGEKKKEA
jgi:hypothetical protein